MPNHEDNHVVVIGKVEDIDRFVAEAFVHPGQPFVQEPGEVNDKDFPVLNFELIVPSPEGKEVGGCSGEHEPGEICWYTWNLEHWGTKWGAYSHEHYQLRYLDGGEGVYGRVDLLFQTAWSQPTPIFAAIEQRWDVTVHAVTQDEGGFPDTIYGDPYDEAFIRKVTSFEFDSYDVEVTKPAEVSTDGL